MKTLKEGIDGVIIIHRPTTEVEWKQPRNMELSLPDKSPVLSTGDRIYIGTELCTSGKNSGGIDEVYAVFKEYQDWRDIIDDEAYPGNVRIFITVIKLTL